MYLNLHIIIDLVINTLKNSFLDDELNIEKISVRKDVDDYKPIKLIINTGEDEDRKYEARIYTKPSKTNKNERYIYGCDLLVMYKGGEFTQVIGSFTAQGITEFESVSRVLNGCWFYEEELEDIL